MYAAVKEVCGRKDGWPKDYDFPNGISGRPLPHEEEGTPYSKASSAAEVVQSLMG